MTVSTKSADIFSRSYKVRDIYADFPLAPTGKDTQDDVIIKLLLGAYTADALLKPKSLTD